jgi:beta-N-acetylhexosaminidase
VTPSALERLCGHLVVCGFPGRDLDGATRAALGAGRRAGVILFRRNVGSLSQVHALIADVRGAAGDGPPPFVSVDQEGGRVERLKAPFPELPAMRTLAASGDADAVQTAGARVGRGLAALGFNLDFAPVLDVDSNPQNPIIGDRAFGRDPDSVVRLAGAFARGLETAGVLSCGKHFPGHGDTELDSHLDLPVVRHEEARLRAVEIAPFAALAAQVPTLMSAHVVYEALDPGVPATLSRRIATELLRDELGFRGVLFSDDLEMRAVADRMPVEESAVCAVAAGCDVLLVCSDRDLADRAHAALCREAETSPTFRQRCEQAAERSQTARRSATAAPSPKTDLAALFGGAID